MFPLNNMPARLYCLAILSILL